MSDLLVDSSYNLALGSLALGALFGALENFKGAPAKVFGSGALLFTAFAAFVAFQTTTLRFQFDDSSFSLVKADGNSVGENAVVNNIYSNYFFTPTTLQKDSDH